MPNCVKPSWDSGGEDEETFCKLENKKGRAWARPQEALYPTLNA